MIYYTYTKKIPHINILSLNIYTQYGNVTQDSSLYEESLKTEHNSHPILSYACIDLTKSYTHIPQVLKI
jgi:hypothetical protein